jgi:hypothetical protein
VGEKQNGSDMCAHYDGYIEKHQVDGARIEVNNKGMIKL